jgi:hypothetical protein
MSWRALLVCLAACSDEGDVSVDLLVGSPSATRALLGDYAIGGNSAFGLARLVHHVGDAWEVAADVSPFGARAQLFEGDALYAASETTLYKLEGTAWSARTIPPAATAVTIVGAVGDVIHGIAPDLDGGAIVTWSPSSQLWAEVPGGRPMGAGARAFLVEDGRITWSDPGRGIVRAQGGVQTVIVDCAPAEHGACVTPLLPLFYAANDELALIACSHDAPPSAALRLRGDELVTIELPAEIPSCLAVTSEPGQAVLATDGILYRLDAKATAWKRIAIASPGLTYVPSGDKIYAFGDGVSARGIYVLDP